MATSTVLTQRNTCSSHPGLMAKERNYKTDQEKKKKKREGRGLQENEGKQTSLYKTTCIHTYQATEQSVIM